MKSIVFRRCIFLILLALFVEDIISENISETFSRFYIENFSEKIQLSNNVINCIVQDTTGFMWIGTSHGLNKYDGNKVTQYFYNPKDSLSIADNNIQCLFVDSQGVLWVLVPMFLCKYEEETDTFIRYPYATFKKNTHTANSGGIIEDKDGNLWIGTPEMGFFCFNRDKEKIIKIDLPVDGIGKVFFDEGRQILWVCSIGEIDKYIISTGEIYRYNMFENNPVIGIDFELGLVMTNNRSYKISCQGNESFEVQDYSSSLDWDKYNKTCYLDTESFLWIGTRGDGVLLYDKEKNTIMSLYYNPNSTFSVSNNTIKVFYQDDCGNIWIGTQDGLNKCIFNTNKFGAYLSDDGLISNIVTALLEDDSANLWITTYDGVSVFNKKNDEFESYYSVLDQGVEKKILNIRDIAKDHRGNMWIGKKQELIFFDSKKQVFSFLSFPYKNEGSLDILSVFADRGNSIWLGTFGNGIYEVDINSHLLKCHMDVDNSNLSSNYIKDIIQLENGAFCFATLRTGIDIYNPLSGKIKNIRFEDITDNYVSDFINCVYQDSRGYLWVLSWFGGFVLDQNLEYKYFFSTKTGLVSDELTAIGEDANHDIWLGTMGGLSRVSFDSDTSYHICNYTITEGLISNSISTGGIYVSESQKIYVGSSNGVMYFDLVDVPIHKHSAKPVITGLKISNNDVRPGECVNGEVVLKKQIKFLDNIELNYKQNVLSIEFSSPYLNYSGKMRYAYRLDGLDKNWNYTYNPNNYATYMNLYPGKYVFRVKSKNSNGIWSQERHLNLLVTPPFWKTWWAYLSYVVITVFILAIVVRFILSRDRLEQELKIKQIRYEKEVEVNNLKIRFFTNISHDIRTPLTLIISPIEHILNVEELKDSVRSQLQLVKNNASYLLTLINQFLDFRKMEVEEKALSVSKYDIVAFVRQVTDAFHSYSLQKNIKLTFVCNSSKIDLWFDWQLMQKSLFNLISNALKFTKEHGEVTVFVSDLETEVEIKVADTGIGIHPEEQRKVFQDFYQVHHSAGSILDHYTSGTGVGLSIVKRYVEMHGSKVEVHSVLGKGSTFFFRLKKGHAHFEDVQMVQEEISISHPIVPFFALYDNKNESQNSDREEDPILENKILLVDDNPNMRYLLETILDGHFMLLFAEDGRQALSLAENELPDIIISDVMMPEMDGFEFVRNLKNNVLTNHIPVLFLTAKSSLEDVREGLNIGAWDYIMKPFQEDVLLAKINNLLNDRSRLLAKELRQGVLEESNLVDLKNKPNSKVENDIFELSDPFLRRVIDFIDANLEKEDLSSEYIEINLSVSKMQLYRKLKAVCGLSVSDVIRKVRVQKAISLLLTSENNVSEIAYKLGFSDPFYFSKVFKKETGMSPLQYKKMQKDC